jgi:hypothetical protein
VNLFLTNLPKCCFLSKMRYVHFLYHCQFGVRSRMYWG